jgi:hypothetical protein
METKTKARDPTDNKFYIIVRRLTQGVLRILKMLRLCLGMLTLISG